MSGIVLENKIKKTILKTSEVAKILGKSETTIKRWESEEKFTSFRDKKTIDYFAKMKLWD
ncbi:hypothetical protein BMR05_14955 [Methylococcaceae bacterium HT4]|nr:hypothetical protein BMR05_14955 [Methylococcaceae bacterium HT4]TXL17038.1 hypothetical protein BMR06_15260 [Methylococcaceae bacterium HT5]TXL19194.1 hypothetical protein BMR03_15455 [Methylococcaceae bacterium HT2]